jgi:hypothetical protein
MIYPIVLGNIRRNAPGFVLDHKIGGRSPAVFCSSVADARRSATKSIGEEENALPPTEYMQISRSGARPV